MLSHILTTVLNATTESSISVIFAEEEILTIEDFYLLDEEDLKSLRAEASLGLPPLRLKLPVIRRLL